MTRTAAAVLAGLSLLFAATASARQWASIDGKFTVEAELVEFANGTVKLKKENGKEITVPLQKLSLLDREFLTTPKQAGPSYTKDVRPFLDKYCLECHNQEDPKGAYDVSSYVMFNREGDNRPLVTPGKPDQSWLILSLEGRKPMPPKKSPQPTPDEVARVTAWINAGAIDDSQAVPAKPRPGEKKPSR